MCTINENHMYDSWDMEHNRQNFSHFRPLFAILSPKQPAKNDKKAWRYYHFAHVYQKLKSWCMFSEIWSVTDRSFLVLNHFLPFNILKKWKKCLETSSFYTRVPKIMITFYAVPKMWCMTDVIVIFHFKLYFALLPP